LNGRIVKVFMAAGLSFAAVVCLSKPAEATNKSCYSFHGMFGTEDANSAINAVASKIKDSGCKPGDILVFRHGLIDISHHIAAAYCDFSKEVLLSIAGRDIMLTCSITER
jgi:hypothetical protein